MPDKDIRKLQSGGLTLYAAPLDTGEEFYKAKVNPKLYDTPFQTPTLEMPELDLSSIEDADALDSDKARLLGEINEIKSQINRAVAEDPLVLSSQEGKKALGALQNKLTFGVNKIKNHYDQWNTKRDYIEKEGNQDSYAVTSNGGIIVRNLDPGKDEKPYSEVSIKEYVENKDKYRVVKNGESLDLRNSNTGFAYHNKLSNTITNAVTNTVSEVTLQNHLLKRLEATGHIKVDENGVKFKSNSENLEGAVNGIVNTLDPKHRNTLMAKSIDYLDASQESSIGEQLSAYIKKYVKSLADPMTEVENDDGYTKNSSGGKGNEFDLEEVFTTKTGRATMGSAKKVSFAMYGNKLVGGEVDRPFLTEKDERPVTFGESDMRYYSGSTFYVPGLNGQEVQDNKWRIEEGVPVESSVVSIPMKTNGKPLTDLSENTKENMSLLLKHITLEEDYVRASQMGNEKLMKQSKIALDRFNQTHGINPNAPKANFIVTKVVVPDIDDIIESAGDSWGPKDEIDSSEEDIHKYNKVMSAIQGKDYTEKNTDMGTVTVVQDYVQASGDVLKRLIEKDPTIKDAQMSRYMEGRSGGNAPLTDFGIE